MTADRAYSVFLNSPGVDPKGALAALRAANGDDLFLANSLRKGIGKFEEACSILSTVKVNGAGEAVIRKAKEDVRRAREFMAGAVKLLDESLSEKVKV